MALDIMMPEMDGIEALSQLRRYMMELGSGKTKGVSLQIGDIELNDNAKQALLTGEPVSLTPKEFGILKLLMEHPGQISHGEFAAIPKFYHAVYEFRQEAIVLTIAGFLASIYLFAFLMTAAGRRKGGTGLRFIDRRDAQLRC